jgi:GalNAc-alpha-(1->4)-GalNAc-alpha-(1->3)-diNAcBac-PP-undecaprenol alpha-1,4-N-acetyl-D-galactosaminyltransferase
LRKRLLILIPNLRGSGCERIVAAMLPALSRRYQVRLVTYDAQCRYDLPGDIDWQVIDSPNVAVASLWGKGLRMLSRVTAIARSMKAFAPDVVLTFIDTCNIVGWAAHRMAGLDCPLVAAEHTVGPEFFDKNAHASRHQRLLKLMLAAVYRRVSCLIAVSHAMVHYMASDLRIQRPVDVIHNGFDVTTYFPSIGQCLEQAGPSAWPRLLAVGALSENKNQQLLIAAFPLIKRHFPNAALTLVGEGELHQALLAQAQASPFGSDIVFAGWSDDVAAHYRSSDLLVHASQYESFGNVLVEGFMCGLPAVCTPATGAYKEVFFAPYCGEILNAWHVEDMAAGVVRVITQFFARPDLRQQLALEAAQRFSLEQMTSSYEAVLESALTGSEQGAVA